MDGFFIVVFFKNKNKYRSFFSISASAHKIICETYSFLRMPLELNKNATQLAESSERLPL